MAKDRFSKFKPANWHSGFKQTGSFIRPYKSEINGTSKPYKKQRHPDQTDKLRTLYRLAEKHLNDWEKNFMTGILSNDNVLSDKQIEIIKKIRVKYKPFILNLQS
jgi:hypothetical protein